jgi:hypothetical protein
MNEFFGFKGNKNLKREGERVAFTKENIMEYQKCSKDVVHFIRNYIKIVTVDEGLVPFDMYDFQEDTINTFNSNRHVICKWPRQSGKSVTSLAYMLWLVLFNDYYKIAIFANKGELARELLSRLKLAYEWLPKWLQQGVLEWNKGSIELENKSKIIASGTTESSGRGDTYNLIFLDELAHIHNNLVENFFKSTYPTISSGDTSKTIIVSTPKGMNMYYRLWSDALDQRNEYIPIDVHWSQIPGRDKAWKEQVIKNTNKDQWAQEFGCEFIGSTNTLIQPSKLRTMAFKPPIDTWYDFEVYERPEQGHTYMCNVDVSHGQGLDHQALTMIDITEMPYKFVGKLYKRDLSPLLYPDIIQKVAKAYNEAFVLVENNEIGLSVAQALNFEFEYENVLMTTFHGRNGQKLGGGFAGTKSQFGVKTTPQVKKIGCSNLKDLIEKDQLIIEDFETIAELTTFVSNGKSFAAEEGANDDLVMSLVIFAWAAGQGYFKEMTDSDIRERLYAQKMQQMEDYMTPFGIIDDGQVETHIVDNTGQRWEIDQERKDIADDPKWMWR